MDAHKSELAKKILGDKQARRDMMDASSKPEGQQEFQYGSKTYAIVSATDSFSYSLKDRPVTSKTLLSNQEYEDGVPYTGDEIHFTDGAIWSCLLYSSLRPISPEEDCVVFIPISFKRWLDGEFVRHPYHTNGCSFFGVAPTKNEH